jgi:general secretion pathway protein J
MSKVEGRRSNNEYRNEGKLHDSKFGVRYSISIGSSTGFTLLELMISIAIIGIMLIILMGVLRLGFRSVETGGKKIDAVERVRISLNLIDSQIRSALPLSHDVNGETKVYFKGDRSSLELATNYSIWEGESGYSLVSYRLAEGDKGKRSLLASESKVGQENKKEIKLLSQFDDLVFGYFYKDPTEEEGKWVDQWTDEKLVPEKIRLQVMSQGKIISLIIPMKTGWSLLTPGIKKKT